MEQCWNSNCCYCLETICLCGWIDIKSSFTPLLLQDYNFLSTCYKGKNSTYITALILLQKIGRSSHPCLKWKPKQVKKISQSSKIIISNRNQIISSIFLEMMV